MPLSTTSSSVTIITREELDKHQVESVADAFRTVPGLTVTANGGRGALTSVFPRGGESDYTLVLVDGVRPTALAAASTSPTFPSPISNGSRSFAVRRAPCMDPMRLDRLSVS